MDLNGVIIIMLFISQNLIPRLGGINVFFVHFLCMKNYRLPLVTVQKKLSGQGCYKHIRF